MGQALERRGPTNVHVSAWEGASLLSKIAIECAMDSMVIWPVNPPWGRTLRPPPIPSSMHQRAREIKGINQPNSLPFTREKRLDSPSISYRFNAARGGEVGEVLSILFLGY